MHMLRIGLAQCRQTDDLARNADTIFRFLDQAMAQDVQILCFPEAQTVGYRMDVTRPDAPVPIEQIDELHRNVAQRCGQGGMACILGTETPRTNRTTTPAGAKPYNSAIVISERGDILGVHHKAKLTPMDAVAYSPGDGFQTFELLGVKVGVVICFEGFRFAQTTRQCVCKGAQLIFHPQNNTTRPNDWKIPIHHAMIVTRAAENTIWFASCNCCYEHHQNSRSMVVAPDGQVYAQTELKTEQLLVTEIDIDRATRGMFLFDTNRCAEVLFGDTVRPQEYSPTRS